MAVGKPYLRAIILSFVSLYLINGCGKRSFDTNRNASLLEADRAFAAASVRDGAAEAFKRFCSDSAIQFTQEGVIIQGNEQIFQRMKAAMGPTLLLDWEPEEAMVSESGDLGYTWGAYTLFSKKGVDRDSMVVLSTGKYVNIWTRQSGTWKVTLDIGVGNKNKTEN